jgi:hypothetical protein
MNKLQETLRQIGETESELAELREGLRLRTASRSHIDQLELLTGRLRTRLAMATYEQKRTLLYALGVYATVWRKGQQPRFTVTCDFRGLKTGVSLAALELTDEEIAALMAHQEKTATQVSGSDSNEHNL